MGERTKMFGALTFIGLIGFLLGIAARFLYFEALPILSAAFPQIFGVAWLVWGLIGAFLAVVCCLIYACLP